MAYYNDSNLDDEELLNNQNQQIGPQSTAISGGTPGQAAAAPTRPDNPGNFVGIKQYLDANKTQSSKLGDQVSGNIQNTIQGSQGKIAGVGTDFDNMVTQGSLSNIGNAAAEAQEIASKTAKNAKGYLTDSSTKRFGDIANALYQGPNNATQVAGYQGALGSITDAQRLADLSKTEAGSKELVKDVANKSKQYTEGANRLDSYFLNAGDNRQKMATARQGAEGLNASLSQVEEAAKSKSAAAKSQTEAVKNAARQALENSRLARTAEIQKGLDSTSKNWNNEYNEYLNLLNGSNKGANLKLDPNQAEELGIGMGDRIYNVLQKDPSRLLSQQAFDANKYIGVNEQAQLAALDKLANTYGGKLLNKYTNDAIAGTQTMDDAFDGSGFGKEVGRVGPAYDKDFGKERLIMSKNRQYGTGGSYEQLEKNLANKKWMDQKWANGVKYNRIYEKELRKILADWKAKTGYENKVKNNITELPKTPTPKPKR